MENATAGRTEVTVVDVKMPFGSMVVFILKWVLASIPAMIIMFLIVAAIGVAFGGALSSLIPTP